MRPSQVAQSGMPGGKHYMGWWGNMGGLKQKGIVQYSLSSYQQRPFAGVLKGYIFNGFNRIMRQVPYFGIPLGLAYWTYSWGKNKYEYYNSKEGHHQMHLAEHGH